jgi:hypothetical protein
VVSGCWLVEVVFDDGISYLFALHITLYQGEKIHPGFRFKHILSFCDWPAMLA